MYFISNATCRPVCAWFAILFLSNTFIQAMQSLNEKRGAYLQYCCCDKVINDAVHFLERFAARDIFFDFMWSISISCMYVRRMWYIWLLPDDIIMFFRILSADYDFSFFIFSIFISFSSIFISLLCMVNTYLNYVSTMWTVLTYKARSKTNWGCRNDLHVFA